MSKDGQVADAKSIMGVLPLCGQQGARDALQCASADEVREMVVERLDPHLGAPWKEQGIV